MQPPSYDKQQSMGYLSNLVGRWLSSRLGRCFAAAGLEVTAEQWGIMVLLWDSPGLAQHELAQSLDLEKSTISRVLALMERRGLVQRLPDPADGRGKQVRLTAKGLALRQPCAQVAQAVLTRAQEGIRPAEMELCRDVLRRMHANLTSEGPWSGAP